MDAKTITSLMMDIEYCLVCREYIGLDHDPAICKNEKCIEAFEVGRKRLESLKGSVQNG